MFQKFICVVLTDNQLSMFGDSKSPGVVASLESIGNLGPNENKVISKELSVFLEKEIGVVPKRSALDTYILPYLEVTFFFFRRNHSRRAHLLGIYKEKVKKDILVYTEWK